MPARGKKKNVANGWVLPLCVLFPHALNVLELSSAFKTRPKTVAMSRGGAKALALEVSDWGLEASIALVRAQYVSNFPFYLVSSSLGAKPQHGTS